MILLGTYRNSVNAPASEDTYHEALLIGQILVFSELYLRRYFKQVNAGKNCKLIQFRESSVDAYPKRLSARIFFVDMLRNCRLYFKPTIFHSKTPIFTCKTTHQNSDMYTQSYIVHQNSHMS